MARKTMSENFDTAHNAAWKEYGKRHYRAIVGWQFAKVLLPILAFLIPAGLLLRWALRTIGSATAPGLPSAPVSAGPWPWVLLGVSAATATALIGYRWANPYSGGRRLIAGIVVCFALSALAILWARSAS